MLTLASVFSVTIATGLTSWAPYGICLDKSNQTMYAVDGNTAGPSNLYTVNKTTGAKTTIATVNIDDIQDFYGLKGIADLGARGLLLCGENGAYVFVLNKANGQIVIDGGGHYDGWSSFTSNDNYGLWVHGTTVMQLGGNRTPLLQQYTLPSPAGDLNPLPKTQYTQLSIPFSASTNRMTPSVAGDFYGGIVRYGNYWLAVVRGNGGFPGSDTGKAEVAILTDDGQYVIGIIEISGIATQIFGIAYDVSDPTHLWVTTDPVGASGGTPASVVLHKVLISEPAIVDPRNRTGSGAGLGWLPWI